MPFMRMQEATSIATSIDTAMNRRDEVGMDMLRDLLPELREVIDDVNAALREVDELLFTGLRDEAVSLNDPDFPRVAARLNLEDKSAWPEAQVFFEREGITPPPKLDFETLAALESSHAELESLGRPLDRIRRLVLERAPILQRLEVLRRLRDADGTKPVWAETIADHERARLTELPEAVKRAFAANDPAAIAALHAELVDPEWSVTVPKDLVKATRGAELWVRLREAVPASERAAAALESGLAAAESSIDPASTMALRQARQEWYQESAAVHDCEAGLAQCSNVAALARADGLQARFAALAPRVQPALAWLEQIDAQEAVVASKAQSVAQLESFLGNLPRSAREEQPWLASVAHLERQLAAQGSLPEALRDQVAAAVATVRGRPMRRLALKGAIGAAVLGTLVVLGLAVRGCMRAGQEIEEVILMLREENQVAKAGVYDAVPPQVTDAESDYGTNTTVQALAANVKKAVRAESDRRQAVQDELAEQAHLLVQATGELKRRQSDGGDPEPWPDVVGKAADAWREAWNKGGFRRDGVEMALSSFDDRVRSVRKKENDDIDDARRKQENIESGYQAQGKNAFEERLRELEQRIDNLPPQVAPETHQAIQDELTALREAGQKEKPSNTLQKSSSMALVPNLLLDDLKRVKSKLDRLVVAPEGAKP